MNAPVIRSVGPPPDAHAQRIVHEMLRWLHTERARLSWRCTEMIDVGQMGSLVGQQRVTERVRKTMGSLALDIRLAPGKRGKFTLMVVDWTIVDAETGKAAEDDGAPTPDRAWLGAVMSLYTGLHHRPVTHVKMPLVVSHHACVRLAQRAGVRTVGDMIVAMRELWRAVFILMDRCKDDVWLDPPNCGWHVPIKVGETLSVVVLERDKSTEKNRHRLVAVTVLDESMVTREKLGPTQAVLLEIMS